MRRPLLNKYCNGARSSITLEGKTEDKTARDAVVTMNNTYYKCRNFVRSSITLGCMTEDKPQAKNGTRSPSAMPFARSTPRSVAARNA